MPFHSLGRLFPDETPHPVTVTPNTAVLDALRTMVEHRYSQLPVVDESGIRGAITLWSVARYLARGQGPPVSELAVEDVMRDLTRVTINTSIYRVLDDLEKDEAVLAVRPSGLQAVVTTWDVLRYLFSVARPFVLLQEIELAIRRIIELVVPDDDVGECLDRSVGRAYEGRGHLPPRTLEELSFEDYRTLIVARGNWERFAPILSSNKAYVGATLERLREVRNRVFHFRTELTVLDYEDLAAGREWLLDRLQQAQDPREAGHG
jgi:CBS domain-containing protein